MATPEGALKSEYTKDRCHPTREGYEVMQPIVQKALRQVLMKK
jgi:lysophospholipase L1-like esterase